MKYAKIYLLFGLLLCSGLVFCQAANNDSKMNTIKFIPKEFHDVKLGYNQTRLNPASPGYPLRASLFLWNEIAINAPRKIIVTDSAFVAAGAVLQTVPYKAKKR
jgi:hypothetical protein